MSELTKQGKGKRTASVAAALVLLVASGCGVEASSEQVEQPKIVWQQFGAIVCDVFVRHPLLPSGRRDMSQHKTIIKAVTEAGKEQLSVVGPNHGAHWRIAISNGHAYLGDFITAAAWAAQEQGRLLALTTQTGSDGQEWIVDANLADPLATGEQTASCS